VECIKLLLKRGADANARTLVRRSAPLCGAGAQAG
jgi:hypothetical protein